MASVFDDEEENLFNTGFGEFQQETARYGNAPPTLKLAMLRYPDAAHAVDLGLSKDFKANIRGLGGHADTGSTTAEVLSNIRDPDTGRGYDSPRKYYDDQKEAGTLREGLSYEDWVKTFKSLGEDERYVAGVAQGYSPLRPTMWQHEYAHVGQFEIPQSGSGKEARQRMRDILYPSLRHPEEIEDDIDYLEKRGYTIGDTDWMQLYENTKLEDEYANEQLRLMRKTPGAEPNLQVFTDWLDGGRTKEGYEEILEKRHKKNLPGLLGTWHKTMGLFDAD